MIPLKNLDDKRFFQLLEEARGYIHRYSDEWTDENYHDPGITFLEMLTWLSEMQRFYLNRVSDASKTQLIELMGYETIRNTAASGIVQFHALEGSVFLPAYSQLKAAEQIFETDKEMDVLEAKIQHIFNYNKGLVEEQSHSNRQLGMRYHPFGESIESEDLWVLILDEPLEKGQIVQLYIDLFEDYPISLNPKCSNKHGIKFKLETALSEKSEELVLEEDATNGFMKSGILRFKAPVHHEKVELYGYSGYPIIIKVIEDYDLLPPQINTIFLNACLCQNIEHRVQVLPLEMGNNLIQYELALIGEWQLQKREGKAWHNVEAYAFNVELRSNGLSINIPGDADYQLVLWSNAMGENTLIGSTTGFPKSSIRFSSRKLLKESLRLQCGEGLLSDYAWHNYDYTDTFYRWGNTDRVFTIDEAEESIVFGNHEFGFMPDEGDDNIQLITLQLSNFERGNIKSGQIQGFCRDKLNQDLLVSNPYDFSGGGRGESAEKTLEKVLTFFKEKQTLVTTSDYERVLCLYPHARILFAKAFTDELVDNQIKLMIIPYNGQRFPTLSLHLKDSLQQYISRYKLITTSIDIIEPLYVEVDLHVELRLDASRVFHREHVYQYLYNLFNPVQGYEVMHNYEVGTVPSKGQLIEALLKYEGVEAIKRLEINIANNSMPINGVIYCNQINLIHE